MVFNAVFNIISVTLQCPVHVSMLPRVILNSTSHNILSKPLATFPHNKSSKTINRGEKGMNHVTMTIFNPWKEYWPSWKFEPATSCSQVFYATDGFMGLGTYISITKTRAANCRKIRPSYPKL